MASASAGDPPPIEVELDIFIPSQVVAFEGVQPFLGNNRDFESPGGSVMKVTLRFTPEGDFVDASSAEGLWTQVHGSTVHLDGRPSWWHLTTPGTLLGPDEPPVDVGLVVAQGMNGRFVVTTSVLSGHDPGLPRIDAELYIHIQPDPEAVDGQIGNLLIETSLTHDAWPNYQVTINGDDVYRHDVLDEAEGQMSEDDPAVLLDGEQINSGSKTYYPTELPSNNKPGRPGGGTDGDPRGGANGGGANGHGGGTGAFQIPFSCNGSWTMIDNTLEALLQAQEDCPPEEREPEIT